MIALQKTPKPQILTDRAAEWTKVVVDKLNANQQPSDLEKGRYRHPDIKSALLAETGGKCAYCESKINHIAYGDIEHVLPKSPNPHLWFEWNNLTIACDICNTNKGEREVVDPYQTDPEHRFIFFGASIWPIPGDDVAFLSADALELNRTPLHGKRFERIEYLMKLLENIVSCANREKKAILIKDFKEELRQDREYAALSRAVYADVVRRGLL